MQTFCFYHVFLIWFVLWCKAGLDNYFYVFIYGKLTPGAHLDFKGVWWDLPSVNQPLIVGSLIKKSLNTPVHQHITQIRRDDTLISHKFCYGSVIVHMYIFIFTCLKCHLFANFKHHKQCMIKKNFATNWLVVCSCSTLYTHSGIKGTVKPQQHIRYY